VRNFLTFLIQLLSFFFFGGDENEKTFCMNKIWRAWVEVGTETAHTTLDSHRTSKSRQLHTTFSHIMNDKVLLKTCVGSEIENYFHRNLLNTHMRVKKTFCTHTLV
jgi:hypothetical protein